MTAKLQKTWNNTLLSGADILAQTEHYAVIHDRSADKFSKESDYFLVLKERNTIESRNGAYSIAMAHMYDAENLYVSMASMQEAVVAGTSSNEKLN